MKPFKLIAIIVAVLISGYAVYIWKEAQNVPTTIDLSSANNFKSIPATVCTIANDASTITGNLYAFHDAARFDITSITSGTPTETHIIVTREDTAFVWQGNDKTGYNFGYDALHDTLNLGLMTRITCKPWWIPAGDLFVVPQDVTFPKR